ncbi:MAG: CBS domain-containing protein [Solirubrobacterales bacterium]|nr:CBS domain-containing protein [Solirubrobacterales bacterium]
MAQTVADIMERDAPTVAPDAGVEEVVRIFKDLDTPALPVVDADGHVAGIITERDLVIADEEGDLHIPHYIELFGGLVFLEPLRKFEARLKKAAASTAQDLMTSDVTVIEPAATVHQAAHLIAREDHSRLPVVDRGRYVGIVSRADVLAALAQEP